MSVHGWRPLQGVRVVDFSMFVPGPFASAIFADLGAEVIKVEMPKGDPGRAYVPVQFATENRNKRSIALDLKMNVPFIETAGSRLMIPMQFGPTIRMP